MTIPTSSRRISRTFTFTDVNVGATSAPAGPGFPPARLPADRVEPGGEIANHEVEVGRGEQHRLVVIDVVLRHRHGVGFPLTDLGISERLDLTETRQQPGAVSLEFGVLVD